MEEIRNKICCLKFLNAVLDKWISETVSGFFFYREGCKADVPRIEFCPFCGRQYISGRYESGNWWWQLK